ncbi:uncharacterized protein Z520_07033 [Fonsecaea multimorphosa CBS 102226]|uniref:C2H2-type domain-containing protein n=1 Tax=Fonsecaea multimorphosa CBS 102226 TaxID=1442371 RepID=A0A0D2K1R5_9EURO|nr:uncharacterized protein Z520_07033 [Fonsecaea multimorphosa CBS 102226]KIX96919.1 hypothetical protein Z520_07033 [Fonsecaea multimorphosa CBS 102226]OAL23117.1 hypothetical protein AYO22_06610 [Fonsecaea multimorphosa]
MNATTTGSSAASEIFDRELTKFRNRLNGKHYEEFKHTSLKDVEKAVNEIQKRQEAEKGLRDLTRIRRFLEAMEQFGNVIEVFTNTSDFIAFVWGPLKFLLQASSNWANALDTILDAYEQIGEALPLLEQYASLFQKHKEMEEVLGLMYKDILEFHLPAIHFLNRSGWRKLFRSAWSDFHAKFDGILRNLRQHRRLIESQFNLLQARQHEAHRIEVLKEIQKWGAKLDDARESLKRREESRRDEQRAAILEWLAAGRSTRDSHERARKAREDYPHTGLWITQNEKVSSWLTDDIPKSSVLWMHGIPGAGKTVLASIIIEACLERLRQQDQQDQQDQQQGKTAYFYCRHDDVNTTTCVSILKGLLAQQIDWYPDLVLPYFEEYRRQSGEPVLTLEKVAKRLFETVSEQGQRQYIILDGLDECRSEERKLILLFLTSLVKRIDDREPSKLRLLVVSQDEPDIRKLLSSAEEFPIKPEDNKQDIRTFVQVWIGKIQERFRLGDDASSSLARRTCHNAAGQFLFAKLVMEHLFLQSNIEDFEDEANAGCFPKELKEVYNRIIQRIKLRLTDRGWDDVQQFLGWMTCAARPLKWHEIQGARSISLEKRNVAFERRRLRDEAHDLCGPLVAADGDRVNLVHSTAKRYIAESEHFDLFAVECRLTSLCLGYLALPCFDGDVLEENVRNGSYAFADYAVAKWMSHFNQILVRLGSHVDPRKSPAYETVVQELCDEVENMVRKCRDCLQSSHAEAESLQQKSKLEPEVCRRLEEFDRTEDGFKAEDEFQSLWAHIVLHRSRVVDKRNEISLDRLKTTMDGFRKLLEELSKDRNLPADDQERLKSYYGSGFFRCPKVTCPNFDEGFSDGKTRDKHVRKHNRSYECLEAACDLAELGFSEKKELDYHMRNYHPDTEMKAQIFKEMKPATPNHAKFGCGLCGKSFVRRGILRDHELAHSGQKPYECARCGKAFTRKNDCTRHEKIHENRR